MSNIHERFRGYKKRLNNVVWDVICCYLELSEDLTDVVFDKLSPCFQLNISILGNQVTFTFIYENEDTSTRCNQGFKVDAVLNEEFVEEFNDVTKKLSDFLLENYEGYFFDTFNGFTYHSLSDTVELNFISNNAGDVKSLSKRMIYFKKMIRDLCGVDGVRANYQELYEYTTSEYKYLMGFSVKIKL